VIFEIFPDLFLSDWDGARPEAVAANEITTVVSLIWHTNISDVPFHQYTTDRQHIVFFIKDGEPISDSMLTYIYSIILNSLERKHKTLLHCAACQSRSPAIAAGFLKMASKKHVSLESCLDKFKKLKPDINPLPEIMESIKNYFGEKE